MLLKDRSPARRDRPSPETDVPKVTYIAFNGAVHPVDVPVGRSLMEGAVGANVPGIDGDCGGAAACATCHIYVPPDWQAMMQPRSILETDMLECAEDVSGDSRLSCQIAMSEALDGLVVRLPASQR